MRLSVVGACLSICFMCTSSTSRAQVPDSLLLDSILSIRAIDTHAHPLPVLRPGATDEFDPPSSLPPLGPPALLRSNNPAWKEAWRSLYGYEAAGDSLDQKRVQDARQKAIAQHSSGYPAWILDKLSIDIMLANRHETGPGLARPRFRLVWFADPLVFPLDNSAAKSANPQRGAAYDFEETWLRTYLREENLAALPGSLDQYMSRLVIPALARRKREGAVAIKFAFAYLRDLRVGNPSAANAAEAYRSHLAGKKISEAENRMVQDFLIRSIIREAGRLQLPVQIHVGAGSGPFFDNAGADPFLLMPVLLDTAFRQATFVLVHGGFPTAAATRVIFAKPNVYVDFSSQAFLSSTAELAEVLRRWLEFRPEKVMFATDAYPLTKSIGWEEIAWMTNQSSRRALAIALTGMVRDGQINRARAMEIARMVMRETAATVYGVK